MPIYEYQCRKCGQFEVMQKISERPLTRCPTCQSKVTKLISNTSFQLKGTGWYITDYGRKDGKTRDTGSTETKSESKADSTTDSKTDKKTSSDTKAKKTTEAAAA